MIASGLGWRQISRALGCLAHFKHLPVLGRVNLGRRGERRRHFMAAEEGAQLVEFAISSGVLFAFVFGFMELCLVFFTYTTSAEAAREASRWASVRGTGSTVTSNGVTTCANPNISGCPATAAQIQNYAKQLPGAANMNIQVWWCNADGQTNCVQDPSNAHPGNIVKVNAKYTYTSVPFVKNAPLAVSSTSEMVIWQ